MDIRYETEWLVEEVYDEYGEHQLDDDIYDSKFFATEEAAIKFAEKKYADPDIFFVVVREQFREPYFYKGIDIGQWEYSDKNNVWEC